MAQDESGPMLFAEVKSSTNSPVRNPVFCQPGFFSSAKTDIRSTRTPKKPGFCEKPGFCWGKKCEGVALRMQHRSKNGEGIVRASWL